MSRKETMKRLARAAKAADLRSDAIARNQASQQWREMATDAEARRAPRYLTFASRPK